MTDLSHSVGLQRKGLDKYLSRVFFLAAGQMLLQIISDNIVPAQ